MTTKRLYIGGLGHSISQKDLKDRFGKFGQVSDVEVVTRKDEDGKCFFVQQHILFITDGFACNLKSFIFLPF